MEKSVKISLIISLSVIIIVGIIVFAVLQLKGKNSSTISSVGEAEISVTPDIIALYLNIETLANSSKEANQKNSEIYDSLSENLKKLAIEEIKTNSFNIFEDIEWTRYGKKSNGWKVVHSLEIKIDSSNKEIGKIIDESLKAGANIGWINFELSKGIETKTKAEAIKLASHDARTKAEALVSGQGKKLGRLISIEESFEYSPWRFYEARGDSSEDVSSFVKANISPSKRKISSRVRAVYEVK